MEHRQKHVGLIGCGFFAANHASAWEDTPSVKLTAVCDLDQERAQRLVKSLGLQVPIFCDARDLMESGLVDFVDIVTQPSTHYELVLLASRHKMPTIIQKPLSTDLKSAARMVAAMQAAGVPLMVHENFRYQKPIREVSEIVQSGRIGRPTYGRISFRTGHDIIAGQPYLAQEKRFVLADLGVHVLDVARFILGEVERLSAETATIRTDIAGEDSASVLMRHTSGAISVVECSYSSYLAEDHFPQTLASIEGTKGSVTLGPDFQISLKSEKGIERWSAEPKVPSWGTPPWHLIQDSMLRINAHWLDCLALGTESATSGFDNLNTIMLVEAAYDSSVTHRTIDLGRNKTITESPA